MKRTTIEDIDHVAHPLGINAVRKPVSEALETTGFAMVYHELEPAEFQRGYNRSSGRVVGAPGTEHDWAETRAFVPCCECGERTVHGVEPLEYVPWKSGRVHLRSTCEECATSFTMAEVDGE